MDANFKFNLSPELNSGQSLSKLAEEKILFEWKYNSEALTCAEWLATIFTFGVYYFITRIYIKRRRFYTIMVTDSRFIFKEEMFERIGFACAQRKLYENQFSYRHKDLVHLSYEYTKTKGALILDFAKFPEWPRPEDSIYESRVGWLINFTRNAFKKAFNDTYDIDLEEDAAKRIFHLLVLSIRLQDPSYATQTSIIFSLYFMRYLIQDMLTSVKDMILEAFVDPSVGPRQLNGELKNTRFSFICTTTEDPVVHEKIRECRELIQEIALQRHQGFLSKNTLDSFEKFTEFEIVDAGQLEQLNQNKIKYRVHNDICPLTENETIIVAAPDNYKWTLSTIWNIIGTFGVYYFEISGLAAHRQSVVFTNKRAIRHSQLLSEVTGLDHYWVDYWIFPEKLDGSGTFTTMKNDDGSFNLFVDAGKSSGGLFTLTLSDLEVLLSIGKIFSSAVPLFPHMTNFSVQDEDMVKCTRTKSLLTPGEVVEVAVSGIIPQNNSWRNLYSDLFSCKNSRECIVLTNKGIYIETHVKRFYQKKLSTVSFASYDSLQGVYWSNFHSQMIVPFCPCCAANTFHDSLHGYNGLQLFISVKGTDGLKYGVHLPSRYYGVSDLPVDTLVDCLNYSMLQRVYNGDLPVFKSSQIVPSGNQPAAKTDLPMPKMTMRDEAPKVQPKDDYIRVETLDDAPPCCS